MSIVLEMHRHAVGMQTAVATAVQVPLPTQLRRSEVSPVGAFLIIHAVKPLGVLDGNTDISSRLALPCN